MKKILLNDLSEAARNVLAGVGKDESIVIEDETGAARYGVIPYRQPTAERKQQAWEKLREWQAKAEASMKKHGVTEDDILRVVLEDD